MTKPLEKSVLHCGACGQEFEDDKMPELLAHIETCPAARLGLNIILRAMTLKQPAVDTSPLAHRVLKKFHNFFEFFGVLRCLHNDIERYCTMVCLGNASYEERSSLHKHLCQEMNFDYNIFQPFENIEIFELPGLDEAKEIFYQGIVDYLNQYYSKAIEGGYPSFQLTPQSLMHEYYTANK